MLLVDHSRPKELIATMKIDESKIRIISTSGLMETLDKWIAAMHDGVVNPRRIYEHEYDTRPAPSFRYAS